jgi:hypothetical protein
MFGILSPLCRAREIVSYLIRYLFHLIPVFGLAAFKVGRQMKRSSSFSKCTSQRQRLFLFVYAVASILGSPNDGATSPLTSLNAQVRSNSETSSCDCQAASVLSPSRGSLVMDYRGLQARRMDLRMPACFLAPFARTLCGRTQALLATSMPGLDGLETFFQLR